VRLHVQIFVAMALGAAVGLPLSFAAEAGMVDRAVALQVGAFGEWFGKVFLTLLNMVVVPLIFSSIVSSITGVGAGGGLGRMGLRTLAYYLCTSFLAISVGILLVNVVRPGDGLDYQMLMEAARGELAARQMTAPDVTAASAGGVQAILADIVMRMVPSNVISAATSNKAILSVIFFAGCFGLAAVHSEREHHERIHGLFQSVYEVMITLTNGILRLAPVGIAGYVLFVTATTGLALVGGLAWYMLTVALALAVHAFVVLPAILWGFTGRSPVAYAQAMKEALLTAFSTASSAGTLPLTMRCATEAGGVPENVTSFTLPLGATVNMDGTALYEAVAVLFVAQMLGDLTLAQQGLVAVTALMASVGAAGIPHAGTVMMVIVLQAVGLPTDAVLVILSVDRVLDMARTTVNVWSDSIGAAVIARYEPTQGNDAR
jgi:Na+/H+-dicarboxylate symporter